MKGQEQRPAWARRIEEERHARGWTFANAALHLRQRDSGLPDTATIAKYWSQRWEPGKRRPGDRYRPHLCTLLGLPHELFDDGYTDAPTAPYVRLGSTATLAAGLVPPGEELVLMAANESASYGRRHGQSNVHPENIEQFKADVRLLAIDFESASPISVVLRARTLRDQTFELLDGRQFPQHTRQGYSLAGSLCGLLGVASSDFFGRYDAASTQNRTAWLCAEMADHNELRSWIRSLQSGVAFWAGQWADAAVLAAQAREYASTAPSATRAAALAARALARLNDADGVRRAVSDSEDARDLPVAEDEVGVIGFSEANRVRCAGTAYLWLGDHSAAQHYLEEALSHYEQDAPDAYAHVMVARADLAYARLAAGDLHGAADALAPALAAPPERRLAGFSRRTSGLRALLSRPEYRGSQAAYDLATQIEQFRTYMVALPIEEG
jgi:tetratricopeptide (TPR) repeat protein